MDTDTGAVSASSVDLGAVVEDSGGHIITAAQLLAGTAPANQNLFNPVSVPDIVTADDSESVELGVQFTASADGSISGIRFYKGPENTGPHVAGLWTSTGTLLASATFSDETASGWQQVSFSSPIAITAGMTYIASYHSSGNYSASLDYFNDPLTNGALSAPDAAGVYAYGLGTRFPDQTYRAANYWVDVVFNAPVTITALTLDSGNGTLLDNNDGTWTYTPAADDDSEASFSYTASDGLLSASSTASLDITPVNDTPVAVADTLAAIEDTPVTYTAAALLGNDADVDNPNSALSIASVTSGAGGTAVLNGDGSVTFTPNTNFNGAADFSYTVSDGTATSSPATVAVSVDLVNDAPTAVVLGNVHGPFAENASTAVHTKIADIAVADVDGGANNLSLSGFDASLFEIVGTTLWLKAGARLDFETNPVLDVTVNVNDTTVGGAVDAQASLSIAIGDVLETVNGTASANTLNGANHSEITNGLAGNDRIIGNGGNDRIVGGLGRDIMTGGAGADVFVFTSIGESAPGQSGAVNNGTFSALQGQGLRDIITDFAHGVDKIDLSAVDANIKVAGNQAFSWRGTGNFTSAPGQLVERLYNPAGTANDKTIIYGDINGDARADFQIELTGIKTLTVSDFIL